MMVETKVLGLFKNHGFLKHVTIPTGIAAISKKLGRKRLLP